MVKAYKEKKSINIDLSYYWKNYHAIIEKIPQNKKNSNLRYSEITDIFYEPFAQFVRVIQFSFEHTSMQHKPTVK